MVDEAGSCAELEPFALQVLGDSMEPEFPDKCVVIIEPTRHLSHGMYTMALVEGVRWFRQYLNDADGERLIALNRLYPEIDLTDLEWQAEGVIVQRTLPRDPKTGTRRNIKRYRYA
jgi:phage repressor protein C with HTH and peptisase S24 domain